MSPVKKEIENKMVITKQLILLFLFWLNCNFSIAQDSNMSNPVKSFGADTILWQRDSLLSFSDFKKKPNGSFQGLTYSGLYLDMKQEDHLVKVYCYVLFICKESFLKDSSESLLKHEQLHFDITELYARKMRQQLSQKNPDKEKSISSAIQKTYNSIVIDLNDEQNRYDKETIHGTNEIKQLQWIDSIHKQLNQLENYTESEVILH